MRSPHDLCLSLSATRKVISMMANSLRGRFAFGHALRLLGVAASLFALSVVASPRAEALSPVNPGSRASGRLSPTISQLRFAADTAAAEAAIAAVMAVVAVTVAPP